VMAVGCRLELPIAVAAVQLRTGMGC
jgi:hypothetical protein